MCKPFCSNANNIYKKLKGKILVMISLPFLYINGSINLFY